MIPLRRADWRFLLPAAPGDRYERLVLLGGGDLASRLGGVADAISTDAGDVPRADLIVVMADAQTPLPPLLRRLRPGAVAYIEMDRRRAGRHALAPGRLRRMLERAGLRIAAVYWVVPNFDQARRHVPLDAPAALEWYLTTLQTAGSRAARLADAIVRVLARLGSERLAAWVPCYTMIAVGNGRELAAPGVLAASTGPVAMLTSAQDDGSRVVLLPFDNGGRVPSRVVKVPRLASFDAHTEREQHTLAALRDRVPDSLRSSLPEPLGIRRWGGSLVAAESYAPGTPIAVSSGRYGSGFEMARDDLRYAVDWLIAFHRATRAEGAAWCDEVVERVTARLESCRGLVSANTRAEELLTQAARSARALAGLPVPIVPLHNDLGPWNMHRDGPRVSVIDWELGDGETTARIGPGANDLFYFLAYWYLRVRHLRTPRAELRGMRELFVAPLERGPAARAAHEEIRRYATSLDLDLRLLPVLLVSMWAERALDREARARIAEAGTTARIENRYVRYLEAMAERADDWFRARRWP